MARQLNGNSFRAPPTGTIAHGIGSGEFTLSMWVYADSHSVDSVMLSGGVLNPGFYCNSSGNVLSYFGGAGTTFTGTLSTGQWYHLMFSRVSNTISLYINGSLNATTQNVAGKSWPDNYLLFGADSVGGGDAWDGPLAEYALWKGVGFGAVEAAALASGKSPDDISPGAGTRIGYWPMIGCTDSSALEIDRWGGNAASPNVSAAYVAHPPIYRMPPSRIGRLGTAAAAGAISCSIAAGASVAAALSGAGALACAVAGVGTVAAALVGAGPIACAIDGSATVTAALAGAGPVACSIDGVATLVCTVTQPGAIAAAIDGAASVSATLVGAGPLAIAVAAGASVSATLNGAGALACAIDGTGAVVCTLTQPGAIAAAIAGVATATLTLDGGGVLAVAILGTSSVSVLLSGVGALAVAIAGSATVTAALWIPTPLAFVGEALALDRRGLRIAERRGVRVSER